jgi:hypothetical protein
MPFVETASSTRFARKRAAAVPSRGGPGRSPRRNESEALRESADGARWRARIARHLDTLEEMALLFEAAGG